MTNVIRKFSIWILWPSLVAFSALATAGNMELGKQKSAQCVACHGPDGNSVNPQWPKIAGQSAQYIIKQLNFFKNNERINPLMNLQALRLSEEDINNLAAHYETQTTSPGAADESLFELGQSIYRGGNPKVGVPACISCHGPNGAGNPAAGFPKLSYQHATYTAARLKKYRSGEKYSGAEIMNGVSTFLSDQDIEAVASYIQGLH